MDELRGLNESRIGFCGDELSGFLQELAYAPLPQGQPKANLWPDWRNNRLSIFIVGFFLAFVAVLGLVACGEKEQVVVYKQGKYQGKPDNRSWDNAPLLCLSIARP